MPSPRFSFLAEAHSKFLQIYCLNLSLLQPPSTMSVCYSRYCSPWSGSAPPLVFLFFCCWSQFPAGLRLLSARWISVPAMPGPSPSALLLTLSRSPSHAQALEHRAGTFRGFGDAQVRRLLISANEVSAFSIPASSAQGASISTIHYAAEPSRTQLARASFRSRSPATAHIFGACLTRCDLR